MKHGFWISNSIVAAVLISGCGNAPPSSFQGTTPPGDSSGWSDRNVPASGFVATPFGWFHQSCMVEVAEDESVQDNGLIVKHGSVRRPPPCRYGRYKPSATNSSPEDDFSRAPPPSLTGWVADGYSFQPALSSMSANWYVPQPPALISDQVVYLFPGLVPPSSDLILQPVLGWVPSYGGWVIASWNCCPGGNNLYSTVMTVHPGDLIAGAMVGSNCDAYGVCANWQVTTSDLSTGQSTSLNTSSYGEPLTVAYGGALEVYYVNHCAQYPASGATTFFNVSAANVAGQQVAWPWYGSVNRVAVPQCGYDASGGPASVTVSSYPTTIAAPQPPSTCGVLWGGQGLTVGQVLRSCDGRFALAMQIDGNLVLYQGSTPLWASWTMVPTAYEAIMQGDSNFVIYDMVSKPLWHTHTNTPQSIGAYLAVQNDGNLVVYGGGRALWASDTCCR